MQIAVNFGLDMVFGEGNAPSSTEFQISNGSKDRARSKKVNLKRGRDAEIVEIEEITGSEHAIIGRETDSELQADSPAQGDKNAMVDVEASFVDDPISRSDQRAKSDDDVNHEDGSPQQGDNEKSFVDREVKQRLWTNRREPIRLQASRQLDSGKGSKRHYASNKLKGKLMHVHQAIGGLICEVCGTTASTKSWGKLKKGGSSSIVDFVCIDCYTYWQNYGCARPSTTVIRKEVAKAKMLFNSFHSSWGNMDLLKADASSYSHIPTPAFTDVNHHLLCTPLPLEQAVCLSSSWKTTSWGSTRATTHVHLGSGYCINNVRGEFVETVNLHVRNLLVMLRHALLTCDMASAAEALASLTSQRKLIPDVIFKAGMEILRQAPTRNHETKCRNFLRDLIETSGQPRTMQMHLELVRYYIECGQLTEAKRELVERVALGRPYSTCVDYHDMLGLVHTLLIAASQDSDDDNDSTLDTTAADGHVSIMSPSNGHSFVLGSPSPCPPSRGHSTSFLAAGLDMSLDAAPSFDGAWTGGAGGALEESDGGWEGMLDWRGGEGVAGMVGCCRRSRDRRRARMWREAEGFEEARRRLSRALEMERSDASSQLLTHLLSKAALDDLALEELERHVMARPDNINGWRRLAEFRLAHGMWEVQSSLERTGRGEDNVSEGRDTGQTSTHVGQMTVGDLVIRWLGLDPVSAAGISALRELVRLGRATLRQLVTALVEALDYGPDITLQELLVRSLAQLRQQRLAELQSDESNVDDEEWWSARREWWPLLHGEAYCQTLWS